MASFLYEVITSTAIDYCNMSRFTSLFGNGCEARKTAKVLPRKFKNTGIPLIKIPLNIARRNCYLDSHCILTVIIPELMPRAIFCKKNH